ncbi:MAG TPA: adenylate/guanylate cyclase domain-containing protein, partial [Xanthomonadales bacterium]|nr:adenylate/guanylate cyclase domain-containing protein [Xanthomonadales bacterium]
MHRLLERALPGAKGESRHVIAMVADIRGFSSFSKQNDSADVASYVSKVYLRLISEFGGVSSDAFFKTTGDGLLFVFPFEEADLEETYNKVVGNAMKCHDSFGDFAKGIRMINFETPRAIAFGISRGSACALVSSLDGARMVLDYSGHKLNLAARLQDLARPSGVILEGSPDVELLQPALREQFTSTDIYVRSVAEKNTIKVFTSKTVKLPQSA